MLPHTATKAFQKILKTPPDFHISLEIRRGFPHPVFYFSTIL